MAGWFLDGVWVCVGGEGRWRDSVCGDSQPHLNGWMMGMEQNHSM